MNTLLAFYQTPLGNRLELHYGGHFWTELHWPDGAATSVVAVPDAFRAREFYEEAQAVGRVLAGFPMKFRAA